MQTKINLGITIDYKGILYLHIEDRIKFAVNQVNYRIHLFLRIILKKLAFPKVDIVNIDCFEQLLMLWLQFVTQLINILRL